MKNYVKAIGRRPSIHLERSAGFATTAEALQYEEYWFFDDADPLSVSQAEQRAIAFKDRHPGTRCQLSVYRAVKNLYLFEIGAARPEPKWRAA